MDTQNRNMQYASDGLEEALSFQGEDEVIRVTDAELEFVGRAYRRTVGWLVSLGVVWMVVVGYSLLR